MNIGRQKNLNGRPQMRSVSRSPVLGLAVSPFCLEEPALKTTPSEETESSRARSVSMFETPVENQRERRGRTFSVHDVILQSRKNGRKWAVAEAPTEMVVGVGEKEGDDA